MRFAAVFALLLLLPGLSGCMESEPRIIADEIKAAMAEAKMPAAEILHLEPLHDGLQIFYRDEEDRLNAGFARLSGDDWRWVIGDGSVELEADIYNGLGWLVGNNRDIPANYAYGVLYDPAIAEVRIRKPDGSVDQSAKIIATPGGTRVWIAYLETPMNAPIEIYGFSAGGKTIFPKVPYSLE